MNYLWGIDLGGTKIEGVIVEADNFEKPLLRLRVPTESEKGYEHIVNQIALVCSELEKQSGLPLPKKLGIGSPGAIDSDTGGLQGSNTQCLNGKPLRDDLARKIGVDIHLINDANCFALAEATRGVGKGYGVVFGVILGTGVGGGIVVNGHVINGRHGIAGEWGQIVLEPGGPVSNYGTQGTIESLIAGPSLERHYASLSGTKRPLKEIVSRASTDAHAQATLDHLIHHLSAGLSIIMNVLDPDAIILGGGVGNIDLLYTNVLREQLAIKTFTPNLKTAILKPKLGDSAGVFGAAMYGAS